jgi:hypothetical protein
MCIVWECGSELLLNFVEFEVLTAVQTTVTLCSSVEVYRLFRGPYCFHLQGRDETICLVFFLPFSSTLKLESGEFLPDYTA